MKLHQDASQQTETSSVKDEEHCISPPQRDFSTQNGRSHGKNGNRDGCTQIAQDDAGETYSVFFCLIS